MRYFIGYLIKGQAAEWHINLSDDIAERFNIWKITQKNPPHITIYYPFETENVDCVKDLLKNWLRKNDFAGNVILSGFDRFDDRVVFACVKIDDAVEKKIAELRKDLEAVVPSKDTILPDQTTWHPHATLAYKIPSEKIQEIWNYVKTLEVPKFQMSFDNVTIFKWDENRWVIEESLTC